MRYVLPYNTSNSVHLFNRTILKKAVYILLSVLLLAACSQQKEPSVTLIAHGGGAIEGHILTNSMEAARAALMNGYRFIEFDLQYTRDSILVAAHSWREFNEMTGFAQKLDTAPTYSEFTARRIYEKYTPATAYSILYFFLCHPEAYLVTDKLSDPALLTRYFAPIKRRMAVEAFNYDDYVALQKSGFYLPVYSCMASDIYSAATKHLLFHSLFDGPKIEWLDIDTSVYTYAYYKLLYRLCDFGVFLFTVNDPRQIPEGYRDNVHFIYTDSLTRY